MELSKAQEIANKTLLQLEPHCYRIQIAGSIRRKKAEVKDIEIVAIPKIYDTGLFESGIATVVNQWEKVKGELEWGKCKYTQRILPEGIKLDLFFATPKNWGLQLAIRTGSADYSHHVLATGWVKRGYKSVDGMLWRNGIECPTEEEIDLFNRIGIPYVEPNERNILIL